MRLMGPDIDRTMGVARLDLVEIHEPALRQNALIGFVRLNETLGPNKNAAHGMDITAMPYRLNP